MSQRIVRSLLGDGDDLLRLPRSKWAPCEQKLSDALDLLEYVYEQEDDDEVFWQYVAKLCSQSYWAFLRIALGYRWMDPFWHGEVIANFIESTMGNDRVIILPRSSGKTAMVSTTYPAWKICRDPFMLCQITNAAEDKAQAFTKIIASMLSSTPRVQRLFPLIRPKPKNWSTKGYKLDTENILSNLREKGMTAEGAIERTDHTLRSYGMRGNITGAHVTLQVHDDLISHEVATSPALLDRAESFLREAFRCCDAQGEIIVAGTRWVYHDFYGKILEGELVAHKGPFRVLKHGIFKPDGSIVWPQRTFVDISGNMNVAGYTEEQVEGFKKDPYYPALYLCEPKTDDSSTLDVTMVTAVDTLPMAIGRVDRVIFETNAGGEVIANAFKQQCLDEGRYEIKVGKLSAQANRGSKQVKIETLLGTEINSGKLKVMRSVWKGPDGLGEEVRQYPKVKHDDLLDCCAYLAKACREPRPGEPPQPVIIIDPAWTTSKNSDPTAIVCGIRCGGDLWILDAKRIRTSRPEVLAQEIFRMFYRWNNVDQKTPTIPKKVYTGVRSFSSITRGRSNRGGLRNGGFSVDLSVLGFNKGKR